MWHWVTPRLKTKATGGLFSYPLIFATLGISKWPRKSGDTPIAHRSEYSVERRKSIRYRMNASVMFRWSSPDNGHYQGEGATRDMSVAGAFVMTATCPPPNAVVQMEVFLPLQDGTSKALMKADMTVVMRVEHQISRATSRSGFSASGVFYCALPQTGRHGL